MKKILTIFFVNFYLLFNAGLIVNLHFCSTAFDHFTILNDPKNCCEEDCPNCDNATYQLFVDDTYDNNVLSLISITTPFHSIHDGSATLDLNNIHQSIYISTDDKQRLDQTNVPVYLVNHVFRI